MKNFSPIYASILALLLTAPFSGCGGGGGGGGASGSGTLKIAVTDAPVDTASSVTVEFTGVEIQPAGGERIEFDFLEPPYVPLGPKTIDLLALSGGGSEGILDVTLPAGRYNWIRLTVNAEKDTLDSFIVIDAVPHSLWIPSGSQTGLKLNRGFVVPANGTVDFTIDFDLRKSVHNPTGQEDNYFLRPTLRIVDNTEVGSIAGTVAEALVTDASCTSGNSVYVYDGSGVTPDDVGGAGAEPVTTALVELDGGSGNYEYKAAFLTAGVYTVAFTCQAGDDDPVLDDAIVFVGAVDATVTAGTTTTVDFL
jgi:hypothetical protein